MYRVYRPVDIPVYRPSISLVCKTMVALPFMFSNGTQILWTLISLYRLYLVIRSVRGQPPPSRYTMQSGASPHLPGN